MQTIKRLKQERGFTLVEMVAVLAIIGMVAVFAIPSVVNALDRSRITSAESQARQIQVAFDQYFDDNLLYPASPAGTKTAAYTAFFGSSGSLKSYLQIPEAIDDSIFILTAYEETSGADVTTPSYELVLEIKNVRTTSRNVHITKAAVTRDTSTSTTLAADWPTP